jgi:hypothetical protein
LTLDCTAMPFGTRAGRPARRLDLRIVVLAVASVRAWRPRQRPIAPTMPWRITPSTFSRSLADPACTLR